MPTMTDFWLVVTSGTSRNLDGVGHGYVGRGHGYVGHEYVGRMERVLGLRGGRFLRFGWGEFLWLNSGLAVEHY